MRNHPWMHVARTAAILAAAMGIGRFAYTPILPLMTALNMLTESALSFLSVGVQSPDASWGTIINDGLALLYTRPMITIAAGLFVGLTAVALNVLGDGVRDALDPNARLRGGA